MKRRSVPDFGVDRSPILPSALFSCLSSVGVGGEITGPWGGLRRVSTALPPL